MLLCIVRSWKLYITAISALQVKTPHSCPKAIKMFYQKDNRLIYRYDAEELWIEPWGVDAFRIRATKMSTMPTEDWALQKPAAIKLKISFTEQEAKISNGKINAVISKRGKIIMYNSKGALLLEEYARNRRDVTDPKCSAIEIEAREFKPIPGGDYHLTMRLESVSSKEKLYGMGQVSPASWSRISRP